MPGGSGGRRARCCLTNSSFLPGSYRAKYTSFMPEGEGTLSKTNCKMLTTLSQRHRNRLVRTIIPHVNLGPAVFVFASDLATVTLVLDDMRSD